MPRRRLEHRSGLRLVRRERDPGNYKAWRLFLTPKGKVFTNLPEQYSSGPVSTLNLYTTAKEAIDSDNDDQNLG